MANYQINAGTLFEDFEVLGDWTQALGSGSPSGSTISDSVNFKTGSKSLQITATNGGVYNTKTISLVGSNTGVWGFWFYVADNTNLAAVTIYLSSSSSLASSFSFAQNVSRIRNGWNFISIGRNDWTNNGGESWDNTLIRLRVRIDSIASNTCRVSFDSLYYGIYSRPNIVIIFDDGRSSAYSEGYRYMKTLKMLGTVGVNSANVDTAGWATLAQLQEMYTAGWDMANHSATHPHMPTLNSSQQLTEMTTVTTYLQSSGFSLNRGGYHFIYPYGEYDTNAILNIATGGFVTGRSIIGGNQSTVKGIDNNTLLYAKELAQAITLTVAKGYIDNAIATGSTCILFAHLLVASPGVSTEWPISDFQSLMDYIAHYRDGNILDVLTMSQWYRGISQSRKIV